MEGFCSLQWVLKNEQITCSCCLSPNPQPTMEVVIGTSHQRPAWTSAAASSLLSQYLSAARKDLVTPESHSTLCLCSEYHGSHVPQVESPRGPIVPPYLNTTPIPLPHPSFITLACWLILTHTRHTTTSGPLYWLVPLPKTSESPHFP